MANIEWTYKAFDALTTEELYRILQLRNEVFVVEQNCVYQDADHKDLHSFHLMAWDNNRLAAYCRILPPQLSFEDASIGRVITAPSFRKIGLGKILLQKAITTTLQKFSCQHISIGAQVYLTKFYTELGFLPISEPYLEDGIPHMDMRYGA